MVIEGFPGATLEQCGLPATGYKNSGHDAEDQRRRQSQGRGHHGRIDTTLAPRLDNQNQRGDVPGSVVRLRDTHGFDVHPLKGVELHRPGPSHVETRHHFLNSSNLIITAQCVCKAANREKSVSEFGPFWSPPATAFRPGRFNLAVTG